VLAMSHTPSGSAILLAAMFLLPSIIAGFFAWATWADREYAISNWRRRTFRYGLFSALLATVLVLPQCSHVMKTGQGAQGWVLVFARLAAPCWVIATASALAGKGAARLLLVSWALLLFLGVLGITMATTP
jgi:hypothetical protein